MLLIGSALSDPHQIWKGIKVTYTTKIRMAGPVLGPVLALGLMFVLTSGQQAMAGETISQGQFMGENKHITTGSVKLEREGDRTFVILGPQFSLDGAPDPRLGFSKAGKYDRSTTFSKLKSLNGKQVYEIPKNISVEAYDTFVIWCKKFGVSLGSAKLK